MIMAIATSIVICITKNYLGEMDLYSLIIHAKERICYSLIECPKGQLLIIATIVVY